MSRTTSIDYDPNDGGECAFLTVTTPEVRVQVNIEPSDLTRLVGVREADWTQRQFIRAGACGAGDAYWCAAEVPGSVLLSIGGHDPESSDIGIVLGREAVDELVRVAAMPGR